MLPFSESRAPAVSVHSARILRAERLSRRGEPGAIPDIAYVSRAARAAD